VTGDYLAHVVEEFPFDAERDGWHPYVLFSTDPAVLEDLCAQTDELDPADDVVALGDGVLYWHNRRDRGVDSAFSKVTTRVKAKATTTNRNLRTLLKLLR
jgi:uncharacterized protein (DUF1697 family)